MNPPRAAAFEGFCMTALSHGAAWQCTVVRHSWRWHCHVLLADRASGSLLRSVSTAMPGKTDCRVSEACDVSIDTPGFRMRSSSQRARYLSGYIETETHEHLQWDFHIMPFRASGPSTLLRIEGRAVQAGLETLFPAAASFLAVQPIPQRVRCAGCAVHERTAFTGTDRQCVLTNPHGTAEIPLIQEARTETCRFCSGDQDLTVAFEPGNLVFSVPLSHRLTLRTQFGRWQMDHHQERRMLDGFYTSVI